MHEALKNSCLWQQVICDGPMVHPAQAWPDTTESSGEPRGSCVVPLLLLLLRFFYVINVGHCYSILALFFLVFFSKAVSLNEDTTLYMYERGGGA